jgi:hypothetical protein
MLYQSNISTECLPVEFEMFSGKLDRFRNADLTVETPAVRTADVLRVCRFVCSTDCVCD